MIGAAMALGGAAFVIVFTRKIIEIDAHGQNCYKSE